MLCSICSRSFSSVLVWLSHMRFHSNVHNISFSCSVAGCRSNLLSYHGLRMHVLRTHNVTRRPKAIIDDIRLTCSLPTCCVVSVNMKDHLSHLKSHMANGKIVACPYKRCSREFGKKSSLTSHLSRCHAKWDHTL